MQPATRPSERTEAAKPSVARDGFLGVNKRMSTDKIQSIVAVKESNLARSFSACKSNGRDVWRFGGRQQRWPRLPPPQEQSSGARGRADRI